MRKLIGFGLLIAAVGCAHEDKSSTAPVANAQDNGPVIVNVVSRHQTVTIRASQRGPLYSVKNDDGKVLVAGVTLEELQRDHPDVYRQVAPAIASSNEVSATADRSVPAPERRISIDAAR